MNNLKLWCSYPDGYDYAVAETAEEAKALTEEWRRNRQENWRDFYKESSTWHESQVPFSISDDFAKELNEYGVPRRLVSVDKVIAMHGKSYFNMTDLVNNERYL